MIGLWVFFPPWAYAVVITLIGRWGESRWCRSPESSRHFAADETRRPAGSSMIVTNLFFLSLVPTTLLVWTRGMLPFEGPRAGLALGIAAFLLGCVPVRLLGVDRAGWDRTLWGLLIDLLRVGGALLLIGWLVGS